MAVRIERQGPVWTVVLSRPERRNAVDGPTAEALADAFRAFDADADARVAVLWGEGGSFCAGADLKAISEGRGNQVRPVEEDGPMGPSRMQLGKPVIAAVAGHAVAGGLELALWCDLRVAEQGQETLYVLVPVSHLEPRAKQDWEAFVNRARENVFARLKKEMGIDDLREHIKFEVVYQPEPWRDRFNLEKGSAFGLSHNFAQVGYMRPHNRHKQYRNLYFAGASTHPGTGLPIVLLSAKLTTERILKEQRHGARVESNQPSRLQPAKP